MERHMDIVFDDPLVEDDRLPYWRKPKVEPALVICWSSRFWRRSDTGEKVCALCHPPLPGIPIFDIAVSATS